MNQAFIDLDELVALCRDKLSRQFIQEAVNCYRAGAYRSCIVATWNAVVFDFIHKMRELELSGNSEAINQLQKFEKLSSDKNVKGLWQFEKEIPKLSLEKFELISHPEKPHIERLFEDRSLCAHPSMASLEEPFEATAELARCHLRSAVIYLLQRPPVQGRSACSRILQRIQFETFPKNPELATEYFKQGLLAGARPSLIKDLLISLTIKLLTDNCLEDERERHFSAINAISNLYLQQTRDILNEKLSRFIEEVDDANLDKAILYLRSVKAWDRLSEPCQIRINIFIQNLDMLENGSFGRRKPSSENVKILLNATCLGFLKETIRKKLDLPLQDLILLKDFCQNELHDMSIQEFIHPLLENNIAQADLEDLISIKLDGNDRLNEKIMPYLSEKIKDASLVDLIEARRKDKSLNDFVESFLQIRIDDSSLDELLESLQWTTRRDREEIMNKFENRMTKLMNDMSFEELIEIKLKIPYKNELFDKLFESLLRRNSGIVIDKFAKSNSFRNADFNINLLYQISDILTDDQWESVLTAFCENNQIFNSFCCPSIIDSLFRESLERNEFMKPYWFSFREKLDKFSGYEYIDKLKHTIDSHSENS